MKKCICLIMILLVMNFTPALSAATQQGQANSGAQQEQAVLTNNDVLEMLKSGLSTELVVAKITSSPSKFDTSPAALQELKTANVPEAVMLAMVQASTTRTDIAGSAATGADAVEMKVPDGTMVEIELMSNISSATAKEGDIVDFTVVNPVIVNGVTVVEKGAPAKARIAAVKKAGYWGKAGRIGWTMQDVLAADGSRVALRMEKKLTGDSKGGTVATATIVTAVVFWPAAPFWGFKKGKNAVFPAGKRFEAFVHGDVAVKGKAAAPATAAAPQS
ncbi:MAG TPA: hypothetical protein VJT09_02675 [Pyrinomonadaceae bacterium]|nr:hypothetical protein [Pyrinomonadaceae bacterium]